MKQIINILCATDDNYAPYCGIMLTSLFESNKESQFEVYVFLDGDLSSRNIAKFRKLEQLYGNRVLLMTIDNELLKDCPVNRLNNSGSHTHITLPTYYRLLASELLPQTVKKIIYFDCDIAIDGDIKPLWETDLEGKAVACIVDCYPMDKQMDERLGYAKEYGYFNAGVVLLNLVYWRNHQVSKKLFDYIREKESVLKYMDQDVLNAVLYDKKVFVPERYNFQIPFLSPSFWKDYTSTFRQTLIEESNNAVVIHYCASIKVWNYKYYGGPFWTVWNRYRKASLWRHSVVKKPILKYVKFLIKKYLFPRLFSAQRAGLWIMTPDNVKN